MQLAMPKHLFASEGRIYPKSESCIRNYTPRVIQYKHTIRVITPFQCSHGQEINKLSYIEQELNEKKKEIEGLKKELRIKDQQLWIKDEQIQRLKQNSSRQFTKTLMTNSIMINKLQKSQVTDIFQSNVQSSFNEICLNNLSNVKSSFLFQPLNTQYCQINPQILKIEEQFYNIENTINQLENVLNKPKKKYQFFNKKMDKDEIQQLPRFIQNFQESQAMNCRPQILGSDLIQDQQQDGNNELDQSIDHTSTNQSIDTNDFLQEAISEHNILKEALIELEKSTKQKMESMKHFYEGQLEYYKRMLEIQKAKKHNQSFPFQIERERKKQCNQLHLQFQEILNGSNTNVIDKNHILDND